MAGGRKYLLSLSLVLAVLGASALAVHDDGPARRAMPSTTTTSLRYESTTSTVVQAALPTTTSSAARRTAATTSLVPLTKPTHVGQILFTEAPTGRGVRIFLTDGDGSNRRAFGVSGYTPQWSPDFSRVSFIPFDNVHYGLSIVSADGGAVTAVPGGNTAVSPGMWSPDGREIAYVGWGRQADAGPPDNGRVTHCIVRSRLDARGRCIKEIEGLLNVGWSADGRRFVYTQQFPRDSPTYSVYSIDAQSGDDQRLVLDNAQQVAVAPDGKFAFVRTADGQGCCNNYEVWVADADGSNKRNLTRGRLSDTYPSWNVGSSHLLVTHTTSTSGVNAFVTRMYTSTGDVVVDIPDSQLADW